MKFRDDFSASFVNQETFMQFLDQVEVNAQWQNYPTNTLKVFSAEENPELCEMIPDQDDKLEILKDTYANADLLLKVGEIYYPVGSTTIRTLENRARVSGNALQDLERAKFARVINDCLQVTKGQALIRIQKVRYVRFTEAIRAIMRFFPCRSCVRWRHYICGRHTTECSFLKAISAIC
ncbi:MAG: hypothetical protein ACLTAC_32285 [Hungatella sp.]